MRVVITLHGIRTRGVWQKDLIPSLARAGFVPYALDYGYFSAFELMLESRRSEKVRWFIEQYDKIRSETGESRPSIIAHSFGTRIVADALEHHPEIRFDKIIFAASIVRNDFSWIQVIETRQANFVENDFGRLDIWPRIAKRFVSGCGDSGTSGFSDEHLMLSQRPMPRYRHSDYFNKTHFDRFWLRTLAVDVRRIRTFLHYAAGLAAQRLFLPASLTRACLWVPHRTGDFLRIPNDLHVRLSPAEAARTVPLDTIGRVNPGVAQSFEGRTVSVTEVNGDTRWMSLSASGPISGHPDLAWTISIPILSRDGATVLAVFCVDGLHRSRPADLDALTNELIPLARNLTDLVEAPKEWL